MFDGAFGNEEAGANERFVAGPIISRGVAVFANCRKQRIAGERRAVFVMLNYADESLRFLRHGGGFGSSAAHDALS